MREIPIIIPAYEPDEKLTDLVSEIRTMISNPIIVVNDGSLGEMHDSIFDEVEAKGCIVLNHFANMGKGRALKDAFNYCLITYSNMVGCITADSDGQHTPQDIISCIEGLKKNPNALVLGVRDFGGTNIPKKSLFGNRITCKVLDVLTGVCVSDTQTGLRAIPKAYMESLLSVLGEKYEFETNMLIYTSKQHVSIVEIPIKTIYIDSNSMSHFNPIKDSIRIYSLFTKYIYSFTLPGLINLLLFCVALFAFGKLGFDESYSIIIATVIAGLSSLLCNLKLNLYSIANRFCNESKAIKSFILFSLIAMCISGGLVILFHSICSIPIIFVKIFSDVILFFITTRIRRMKL